MTCRDSWKLLLLYALGCTLAVMLTGCGGALKSTYASLLTAERLVTEAARVLPAFDERKQAEIIATSKTVEEGRARLEAWRLQRMKVVQAISGAHSSVQLARDAVAGIEKAAANPRELDPWLTVAMRVYQDLLAVLHAVGVQLPRGM